MTREEAVWYVNHTFEIIKEELCNSGRFDEAKEFEIAQNMAIEALSAEVVHKPDYSYKADIVRRIKEALSTEVVHGWIPIKYHEITEIERKENGYPKDWVYFLDCEMPQDGQEILVQAKNGEIRWDVCYEDDGFSLDSGWDWKDDIIAWMPLPEPYKGDNDK